MTADNWGICPQCHKNWKEPPSGYGELSEEEYLAVLAKGPKEEQKTLREDYGIGTDEDGEFTIDYSCSCSVCGFSFSYGYSQHVPLNGTNRPPKGQA